MRSGGGGKGWRKVREGARGGEAKVRVGGEGGLRSTMAS